MNTVLPYTLYAAALGYGESVSLASALAGATPIFAAGITFLLRRERVDLRGLLLGLLGVLCIVFRGGTATVKSSKGLAPQLLGVLCKASAACLAQGKSALPPVQQALVQAASGALLALLLSMLDVTASTPHWLDPKHLSEDGLSFLGRVTAQQWLCLLCMALLGSCLVYLLQRLGLQSRLPRLKHLKDPESNSKSTSFECFEDLLSRPLSVEVLLAGPRGRRAPDLDGPIGPGHRRLRGPPAALRVAPGLRGRAFPLPLGLCARLVGHQNALCAARGDQPGEGLGAHGERHAAGRLVARKGARGKAFGKAFGKRRQVSVARKDAEATIELELSSTIYLQNRCSVPLLVLPVGDAEDVWFSASKSDEKP